MGDVPASCCPLPRCHTSLSPSLRAMFRSPGHPRACELSGLHMPLACCGMFAPVTAERQSAPARAAGSPSSRQGLESTSWPQGPMLSGLPLSTRRFLLTGQGAGSPPTPGASSCATTRLHAPGHLGPETDGTDGEKRAVLPCTRKGRRLPAGTGGGELGAQAPNIRAFSCTPRPQPRKTCVGRARPSVREPKHRRPRSRLRWSEVSTLSIEDTFFET